MRNGVGRTGNAAVVEMEIKQLERELCLPSKFNIEENEDADFWLQLPRTFSYQSARYLIDTFVSLSFDPSVLDHDYSKTKVMFHFVCIGLSCLWICRYCIQ